MPCIEYGRQDDPATQAHRLFSALRELDRAGAKVVYARCPEKDGVSMAVYNRLIRCCGIPGGGTVMVVGLTGRSGCGKSSVSAFLTRQGYPCIDADAISPRDFAARLSLSAALAKCLWF